MHKMAFMIVPLLFALAWLATMVRFLTRFARSEPAAYDALGRPVMRFLMWNIPAGPPADAPHRLVVGPGVIDAQTYYTPEQVHATLRLISWIVRGGYGELSDPACRRRGVLLRVLALVFPLVLLGTMAMILR